MVLLAAALDGVAVQVGTAVTQKNACLYDILFDAPPSTIDRRWGGFNAVIEGFSVGL